MTEQAEILRKAIAQVAARSQSIPLSVRRFYGQQVYSGKNIIDILTRPVESHVSMQITDSSSSDFGKFYMMVDVDGLDEVVLQ